MQRTWNVSVLVTLALGALACSDGPMTVTHAPTAPAPDFQRNERGTGLVLDNLTGVTLPLIGQVGDVDIDQANIVHLGVVEDVAGNIIGLEAEGVLKLTGGVLGTNVVTEDFLTQVHVVSSGPGQCDVLTVDLGPITLDALGGAVSVDVPNADVTPRASGAVGPLLCALGAALQPPVSATTGAVRGLVNAINRLLI